MVTDAATQGADRVQTYLRSVDWLIDVVGHAEVAAAWEAPSALARYSTGGVASHAVQAGVLRLEQLLREPAPAVGRLVTVADFCGPNRVEDPSVDDPLFAGAREGAEAMAREGPARLLTRCREGRADLADVLPTMTADRPVPVLRVPGGTAPLADYLRTRILEVVVHGDDVVASVAGLIVADPPAPAVAVCVDLCVELARTQVGDLGALRAFTRTERAVPGSLRVL